MIRSLLNKHGFLSRQFVLYGIIGLSGVTVDFVLYFILTTSFNTPPVLANFVSISVAIANNFWLNKVYNFKVNDHLFKRFLLFYSVGFVGIVASEILLIGFHYVIGLNDLVAKLLTLPFILVLQFILNRSYSFGDMKQTSQQLKRHIYHWPLLVIFIFYAVCSVTLVRTIPADFSSSKIGIKGGPDEAVHYRFNVEFIMREHRLPISGKDDIEAYEACRDNPIGQVPCVYSYNIYPGPNYIASAISAEIFGGESIKPQVASRFTSLVSGMVFVVFAYLTVYMITRRRLYAALLTAAVCFIPQVIFTNSYTNLDAHSLAISSILAFSLVGFMQNPRKRMWQILCAVSLFGLLPVSKYNYFVLGLASLILILYTFRKVSFSRKEILRFGLYGFVSFVVLASFWYIRNLVHYHDLTGQNFVLEKMSEFHSLGKALPFNLDSLVMFVHLDFFNILFRSFFFGFGGMFFFLEEYNYMLLQLLLLVCASLFIYITMSSGLSRKILAKIWQTTALYVFVVLTTLGIIVYNSLVYDFQPQGRYMYPILVPTIMLLAYAIKNHRAYQIIAFLLFAGTVFIFIRGLDLYVRAYITL